MSAPQRGRTGPSSRRCRVGRRGHTRTIALNPTASSSGRRPKTQYTAQLPRRPDTGRFPYPQSPPGQLLRRRSSRHWGSRSRCGPEIPIVSHRRPTRSSSPGRQRRTRSRNRIDRQHPVTRSRTDHRHRRSTPARATRGRTGTRMVRTRAYGTPITRIRRTRIRRTRIRRTRIRRTRVRPTPPNPPGSRSTRSSHRLGTASNQRTPSPIRICPADRRRRGINHLRVGVTSPPTASRLPAAPGPLLREPARRAERRANQPNRAAGHRPHREPVRANSRSPGSPRSAAAS